MSLGLPYKGESWIRRQPIRIEHFKWEVWCSPTVVIVLEGISTPRPARNFHFRAKKEFLPQAQQGICSRTFHWAEILPIGVKQPRKWAWRLGNDLGTSEMSSRDRKCLDRECIDNFRALFFLNSPPICP